MVRQVAGDLAGEGSVAMINVQENQQAAMAAGIRSIPAMLVMRDGEILGQIGARDRESIIREFREFF